MKDIRNDFMLFSLLSQTLELMKLGFKSLFRLSFFALFLPGFILGVYFRAESHSVVEGIKELTDKMGEGQVTIDLTALLGEAQAFILLYALAALIFIALFVTVYVASTYVALANLNYYQLEYQGFKQLFFKSLKVSFPRIWVIMAVALFIGAPFGLMRVFGILLLVSVNIMLVEKKGVFSSLWQSLTFKYASVQLWLRLKVFASLAFLVLLFFSLGSGLFYFSEWFLSLDKTFINLVPLWSYRPNFLPCTLVMLCLDGLNFFYSVAVALFLSHYLSCLYVSISKRPSERK